MPPTGVMRVCVLLWAHHGNRDGLARYQDAVLSFLTEHTGRVVHRVSAIPGMRGPDEVQILEFGSRHDLESFAADPRHGRVAKLRTAAVAHAELMLLADTVHRS